MTHPPDHAPDDPDQLDMFPALDPQALDRRILTLAQRQEDLMRDGLHPLTLVARYPITLHEQGARSRNPDDDGLRCGSCAFRQLRDYHNKTYAKCVRDGGRYISHSERTDARAWWGACRFYQPAKRHETRR